MTTPPSSVETVLLERDGAIATLRFNRPEAFNAANPEMAEVFRAHCRALTDNPDVRAIVLAGAGKAFMAGGDLATLQADPLNGAANLIGPLHAAVELLAAGNAPVLAAVHGAVAGAGMSLMLQADYVLAAEGTRFNLAYVNIGTSCDVGASWALPRLVGLRKALEIAMLGDSFDAVEALRIGMINRVVPVTELAQQTAALAQRLAAGPTVALGNLRRLMRDGFERGLHDQLSAEAAAFRECAVTSDFIEGVDAFFEKRTPAFRGS